MYKKKDHYHQLAKKEGFLARSAYKLQEIQKKFHPLRVGQKVLDLGCAPGAWSQVVLPIIGKQGILVGVDLEEVAITAPNARFLQADAFTLEPEHIPEAPFDCILSDMAPKTSGIRSRDQLLSAELCRKAIELSDKYLRPSGCLVLKIFEGNEIQEISQELKRRFQDCKKFRPQSTRQASFEIYLIALNKKV